MVRLRFQEVDEEGSGSPVSTSPWDRGPFSDGTCTYREYEETMDSTSSWDVGSFTTGLVGLVSVCVVMDSASRRT